ncbi:unnamed protein product [Calypogeia fissa]
MSSLSSHSHRALLLENLNLAAQALGDCPRQLPAPRCSRRLQHWAKKGGLASATGTLPLAPPNPSPEFALTGHACSAGAAGGGGDGRGGRGGTGLLGAQGGAGRTREAEGCGRGGTGSRAG